MDLQKVIDSIMSDANQFMDENGEWQEELIMSHFKLNERQLKFVLERLAISGQSLKLIEDK